MTAACMRMVSMLHAAAMMRMWMEDTEEFRCLGRGEQMCCAGGAQMRDRARRFISLLDELYNARTRLIVSAASPPHLLFQRSGDVPILDLELLESIQTETAVEGAPGPACPLAVLRRQSSQ